MFPDVPIDTGTLTLLNGLAQGLDVNQRIGRQVAWRSLQIRCAVDCECTDNVHLRVMIVKDRQADATAPTLDGILDNTLGRGYVNCMRNLNNRMRFQILQDKTYSFSPSGSTSKEIKLYKKMFIKTQYTDSAATIASIATNSLYIVAVSDDPSGEPACGCYGSIRLRYTDM